MKAAASLLIAGGLGAVVWGGMVSHGILASAEPRPVVTLTSLPVEAPKPVTDADRRSDLNRRLSAMVAEGRGSRLTDAPPARAAAARQNQNQNQNPTRTRAASRPAAQPLSAGEPGRLTRTGYVAPRLDLTSPVSRPSDPVECLTQAVYYEARSESEEGQAAVAEVVLNRAASGRYPSDICEVVYQRNARTCQFTFTCDGSIGRYPINEASWARASRIAREVYNGQGRAVLPERSVNYHANYVRPTWSSRLEQVRRIGAHIFYGADLDGRGTPGTEGQREPAPQRGLVFVKNETLDRAYAMLMRGRDSADKDQAAGGN